MVLLFALFVQMPDTAVAQATRTAGASSYLYLDHWAYPYIDFLQERGRLNGLYRMVRPYSRHGVAASLREIDPESLNSVESHIVSILKDEFAAELWQPADSSSSGEGAVLTLGVEAQPAAGMAESEGELDFNLNTKIGLNTRYFSAFQRMRVDDRLAEDPSYFGRQEGGFGARMEDAYGLVQFSALTFFLGRTVRAWGPGPGGGFLISTNPYSYDHVGFQVETKHLNFTSLVARLDDTAFGNQIQKRFLTTHRLDVRVSDRYQFGISESSLYGGADAGFDPALMNPFGFLHEVQLNSGKEANTMFTLDWWIRPLDKTVFFGEFLLDDFVLDGSDQPPPNRDTSPDRLGLSLGLKLHEVLFENGTLCLSYRRVGNYTYNVKSKRPWQAYTFEAKGLGARENDFDRTGVAYSVYVNPRLQISGHFEYLRNGARTLASNDFEDSTFVKLDFPSGTVERTLSVRLSADFLPNADFNAGGFVGLDRVGNAGNVKGKDDSSFSFGLYLYVSKEYLFRWPG